MECGELDYRDSDGCWRVCYPQGPSDVVSEVTVELGALMQLVNWGLIKNPLNWVIVLLMLLIAGFAGHYSWALIQNYRNQPSQ